MRSVNIRHVVSDGRELCHPRSELQQAEIVFSRDSLLQNLSTFSVGYVCTAAAVTKHKYMQQQLYLKQNSEARGSYETEMRKLFLGKCERFWILFEVRTAHIRQLNTNFSVNFASKDRILYLSFLLWSAPGHSQYILFQFFISHHSCTLIEFLIAKYLCWISLRSYCNKRLHNILYLDLNSLKYLFFWIFLSDNKDDWNANTREAIHNKMEVSSTIKELFYLLLNI